MQEFNKVINNLPPVLCDALRLVPLSVRERVAEIRLRINRPLMLCTHRENVFIGKNGEVCEDTKAAFIVSKDVIEETLLCITGRALHSRSEELKKGFVTMKGGHRVGVASTAVMQNGEVSSVKDITSLNIRIAKNMSLPPVPSEIKDVLGQSMFTLLIAGAPRSGKTTLLKSIVCELSDKKKQVAVIDTRFEIVPDADRTFDCCDVLFGYPRDEGIICAVKSLSPDVIICDELGDESDAKAVRAALGAGVSVVATAHASTKYELERRPATAALFKNRSFSHVAMLYGKEVPGLVTEVSLCR